MSLWIDEINLCEVEKAKCHEALCGFIIGQLRLQQKEAE